MPGIRWPLILKDMHRFNFIPAPLTGVFVVERLKAFDQRGFFSRFFCVEEFRDAGLHIGVAQMNHTLTQRKGAVRGMHFQYPPHAEDKLVSCLRGEIYDVAVDLRSDSDTFLHWHAEILSANNARSLFIPSGFAHGFQTLSEDCELLYLHSKPYAPSAEGALNARDPTLAIFWPLPFSDISERDASHPYLTSEFHGIRQ